MLHVQGGRLISVVTPLGLDLLLAKGFRIQESISQLFRIELEVLALPGAPVPFEKLLGQKIGVMLDFEDAFPRTFNGLCCRISESGRDEDFDHYRMELVPELWLWTRKAQSRIFQQKTVPEILKEALVGLNVTFDLKANYFPRNYCVQYRETDFNFVSRLMEEEGIFYYYVHELDKHKMIVSDDPTAFPPIAVWSQIEFEPRYVGERKPDRVVAWEKTQELRPGKFTLWDHNFELPGQKLDANQLLQESAQAGAVKHQLKIGRNERLEIYDYPGEFAQRFDGINPGGGDRSQDLDNIFEDNKRVAKIRMEEQAVPALTIRGVGHARFTTSGHSFELIGHHNADGPYVLVSVTHEASQKGAYHSSSDGGNVNYNNSFTCIPASLPYRPARTTPKPIIQGAQTATVVGPPGEEIFTDKYGRVKVQFHWHREGHMDSTSSCWIRVAQFAAGGGFGGIFIPRIGQEVIVQFEEGDPDCPIIVGSVYNPSQMPPFGLPDNRMISGFRSNTYPGGGGDNEISVDDSKGKERMYIHSQYNQDSVTGNNRTAKVGVDSTESVGNNSTQTIGVDKMETVGNNKTVKVANNVTKTIGANKKESVGANKTVDVAANQSETIGANMSLQVKANKTETVLIASAETVGVTKALTVGGAYQITVGGASNQTVAGMKGVQVGMDMTEAVAGHKKATVGADMDHTVTGKHVMKAQEMTLTAQTKLILMCGASMIEMTPGMITIKAPLVKINC